MRLRVSKECPRVSVSDICRTRIRVAVESVRAS